MSHPPDMQARFRRLFWQPPRRHGDIIEERTVSFLELFYDLVYVVLIARAAHTLAHHVSWRAFGEFAVVFGLIWIAWLNGTFHHELHGREDGRSRTFIFIQMTLLAVLAVYTSGAAGSDGAAFAATYTLLLLVLTWLWYTVRRQDEPEFMAMTGRYLMGMGVSAVVVASSVIMPSSVRMLVWGGLVVVWVVGGYAQFRDTPEDSPRGMTVTDSMVERFGLFTIIVLGETVVGVVDGLSEVQRDARAMVTGIFSLMIGFGFWWTYFDFVGRRKPRDPSGIVNWTYSHLPVSLGIAASGAAMVSLIEHAGDTRAPPATAWLLAGSVAMMLLALIVTMRSLQDATDSPETFGKLSRAAAVAATLVLLIGWWRPTPWLLALATAAVLSLLWFFALDHWLRSDDEATPFREPA